MLRYNLRTLLILLAILQPLLGVAWVRYAEWRAEQARRTELERQANLPPEVQTFDPPMDAILAPAQSNLSR